MTTKTVKCTNCNIVINEVLAFIQNKSDVTNEESLSAICLSAFSNDDILAAKSLLFESCPTKTLKNITRKGAGKSKREIDDIISFFKQVDPEELPIFVARELQKLPPITFDHIDVTSLLKKLLLLENDMLKIKETYITIEQFSELKQEVTDLRNASIVNNFGCNNVNKKRGAYLVDSCCDSGPIGLTHFTLSPEQRSGVDQCDTDNQSFRVLQQKSIATPQEPVRHVEARTAVSNTTATEPARPTAAACAGKGLNYSVTNSESRVNELNAMHNNPPVLTSTEGNKRSFVDIVKDSEWKISKPDEEWTQVQRRRLRNRFIGMKGKANKDSTDNFKAADIRIPLFINNVDKKTREEDIINYIFRKTQVQVSLDKISMKFEKEYNAFKIYVPRHKMDVFLDSSLWPEGISFRKYINFRNRTTEQGSSNRVPSPKL